MLSQIRKVTIRQAIEVVGMPPYVHYEEHDDVFVRGGCKRFC